MLNSKTHKFRLRFHLFYNNCYILLLNSLQTLENTGFVAGELSLIVSLVLYLPPVFTNSDKGKYKGAGHPVDVRFAPTVAKRRPRKSYKTV